MEPIINACPFCHGKMRVTGVYLDAEGDILDFADYVDAQGGVESAQVYCLKCEATGPILDEVGCPFGGEQEAINFWNSKVKSNG
jgi:hypothetical protein